MMMEGTQVDRIVVEVEIQEAAIVLEVGVQVDVIVEGVEDVIVEVVAAVTDIRRILNAVI